VLQKISELLGLNPPIANPPLLAAEPFNEVRINRNGTIL